MREEFQYYALLGCHAQSTDAEVTAQWRTRAHAQHPDRPGGSAEAFALLSRAYHAIRNARGRERLARLYPYHGTGCDACGATGCLRSQRGFSNVVIRACPQCLGAGWRP